ncbi:hypothetical protein [Actinorugispora endophytica]|uniref:Uncharacterized protein n=1 Tax=Actinorugispora endophytica TaxID=1605990 RepID=A0A4R6UBX4_9ACTN|nr:hypothetical protein [Actinorugispora endophytica]TDQ44168.1 hypothetical protein EV190_1375 [Actinorugispora endophytica]
MRRVLAVRYPDGSLHVPVSYVDPDEPAVGCGVAVLRPGDPGYDHYASHAISSEEYEERRHDDPAESARLRAAFKRRYAREHGRRFA